MGSHSITCHPAEVTFPPLPQLVKAGTRFSDPRGMQGWVNLVGLLHTEVVYPPKDGHVTHPSTNRAQRWVTSFVRRTTLPQRWTAKAMVLLYSGPKTGPIDIQTPNTHSHTHIKHIKNTKIWLFIYLFIYFIYLIIKVKQNNAMSN